MAPNSREGEKSSTLSSILKAGQAVPAALNASLTHCRSKANFQNNGHGRKIIIILNNISEYIDIIESNYSERKSQKFTVQVD